MKNTLKSLALIALTSALWAYVMHRELENEKKRCDDKVRKEYYHWSPV